MTRDSYPAISSPFVLALLFSVFSCLGIASPRYNACSFTFVEGALDQSLMYLKGVNNPAAVGWSNSMTQKMEQRLHQDPRFAEVKAEVLSRMDDVDRFTVPHIVDGEVIDFHQSQSHPRGIWRKASEESYRQGQPNWVTYLDIDALAEAEGKDWVFGGSVRQKGIDRMFVYLSVGGTDASVLREFDLKTKQFVEDGFNIMTPLRGNYVSWINKDQVLVGSRADGGLTSDSEYPLTVRIWDRGQPLSQAKEIFRGAQKDLLAAPWVIWDEDLNHARDIIALHEVSMQETSLHRWNPERQVTEKLPVPHLASFEVDGDHVFVLLKEDFTLPSGKGFKDGDLLTMDYRSLIEGKWDYRLLYRPSEGETLESTTLVGDALYMILSRDVNSVLVKLDMKNPSASPKEVYAPVGEGMSFANGTKDGFQLVVQSFLNPVQVFDFDPKTDSKTLMGQGKSHIDSDDYEVKQFFAPSADGTRVPFYLVAKKGLSVQPGGGDAPALLYGYGGFQVTLGPSYNVTGIRHWVDQGGILITANLRGGGEYGASWWQQAVGRNKVKSYEDMAAIAEELVRLGYSAPGKMAVQGGSNGGLMSANMMVRRPDLFGAAIIDVPLIDMLHFHKLLAGASWQGEYGFPTNPEDVPHLTDMSPNRRLDPEASYPTPFIFSSRADDRVHPYHARVLSAKMQAMGFDVIFSERATGGHNGSVNNAQRADRAAEQYIYLYQQLID